MKNIAASSLIAGALTITTPMVASAQEESASPHSFSGNVSITNDYKFYGISQSGRGPSIQGGLDYAHDSGFYIGTWASSVDFQFAPEANPATIELDYYGGFASEFSGVSYDLGLWFYTYPGQSEDEDAGEGDFDYYEAYINLGYTFGSNSLAPTLGVGIYYSPDFFGEDGDSIYVPVSLDVTLPYGIGLYGNYGYFDLDGDNSGGADYSHYKFGATYSVVGMDFDLGYADAGSGCEDFAGSESLCEGLVFSIGRSF